MKISLSTIIVVLLLAGVAMAAGVDGKWTAQVPGRDGQTREAAFTLKADGAKLTGSTTGPGGQELAISDGKVDGDNISFTIKMQFQERSFVLQYKGKVSGDEIKFTVGREGADQTREFTAKRAK